MKKMVAICDILGFKELVLNNDLTNVVDRSLTFFRKAFYHSVRRGDFPDDMPTIEQIKDQNRVGFTWFSDTVLIYALGDNDDDCRKVIETVGWLAFETIFRPDTKIRAGISYGDVYIDGTKDIYLGSAIIEANKFQADQDWAGGALTDSAAARIPKYVLSENLYDWYLTEYHVPLKTQPIKLRLAVDWTRGIHMPLDFIKLDSLSPDVTRKMENTKRFHDSVCAFCKVQN